MLATCWNEGPGAGRIPGTRGHSGGAWPDSGRGAGAIPRRRSTRLLRDCARRGPSGLLTAGPRTCPPKGASRGSPCAPRARACSGRATPGGQAGAAWCGAVTPASPGAPAAAGAPRGRPPPPRPAAPIPGARVLRSGRRVLWGTPPPGIVPPSSGLHAPRPPARRAARLYEYVKRLHCPARPRPLRGPARARGGGEAEAGPGQAAGGPGRSPRVPRPPSARPLRASPPSLGARRGLGATRPPSAPPLIIIILSTNKLC